MQGGIIMKKKRAASRLLALALALSLGLTMVGSASAQKKVIKAASQPASLETLEKEEATKAGKTLEKGKAAQTLETLEKGENGELHWEEEPQAGEAGIEAQRVVSADDGRKDSGQGGYKDSEEVRVFIVLEGESALEEGFSAREIVEDGRAQSFSRDTQKRQDLVVEEIEQAVSGRPLEVRYQFSLLSNAVSAVVQYKDIEKIQKVDGVRAVYEVPRYRLQEAAEPQTITAGEMVGSYQAWDSGYTGAGQRIAIVDTGIDLGHPSFDPQAFSYGREITKEKSGHGVAKENLLDEKEIAKVFSKLKVGGEKSGVTPKSLYRNEKIAFAFNYAGKNLDVSHEEGDHGTHVAGIAAANQYVPAEKGTYQEQEDGVAGIAKDAQLLVMKVFADSDETYTDDYMAAVEDALLLDADVVNMSLGTPSPGESTAFSGEEYVNQVFDRLLKSDVVVSISAGNNGSWADASSAGHNRAQDVNMNMVGSPGSYTNALAVASAVNAGYRDSGFRVGKRTYFYSDAQGKETIPSLGTLDTGGKGTDYKYVFLESFGEEADYQSIDVKGKVVIVSKGVIPFAQKHENAQKAGAAALIIYNDDLGFPKLNLSESKAEIPCAIMGWEDSWSLQEAGSAGTLCIFCGPVKNAKAAQGYQMSDFSAWGVPGNLALKPEITAPGENIYATLGGGGYGCMSGTSMAAPSIAGMSALVLEYIEREGLVEKTGLDKRALAQSLLMSTAVPLKEKDKEEYSPRKQGSGLANVSLATTTPSCLFVGNKKGNDGKVKAELGDDPQRKGVYEFSFKVCNMTEENQYYTLDGSILSEELSEGKWIAGSSHKLRPKVTFSSESRVLWYDLNGDGRVDGEDAAELLRHVNQSVHLQRVECNQQKFDFLKDGVIDTADVYAFLKELEEPTVDLWEETLEVKDEASVSVKVELSSKDKKYLDSQFEHGMYIDGFVYLRGAVDLSVPMLAFYGNWTESSMFEPFDYLEFANGGEREAMTYSGIVYTNYLNYYTAEDDSDFCYGSNMYLEGGDENYLPERNAFSTNSGDRIESMVYSLIRNAALIETSIVNDKTGEIYYKYQEENYMGAYYDSKEGGWRNTEYSSVLDWQGLDNQGKPLPEGSRVRFTVTALPQYYQNQPENAAEGARFSVPITIDNTKPKLINMEDTQGGKIRLTFQDNRFTAAVKVYDRDKETLLNAYGVNQEKAGVPMQVTIKDPKKVFYLKLVDYAGNTVSYRVNRSGSPDTPYTDGVALDKTELKLIKKNSQRLRAVVNPEGVMDDSVTWSSENSKIATVDQKGVVTGVTPGTTRVIATTKAKNTAGEPETAVCQVTVEEISVSLHGILWTGDGKTWFSSINTSKLPEYTKILQTSKECYYTAATVVGNKILAARDGLDSGLYLIDPSNRYQAIYAGNLDKTLVDMAYSPNNNLVFGVEGVNLHCFQPDDIDGFEGVTDMGDVALGEKLVGITYAGSSEEAKHGLVDWFYVVTQGGRLVEFGYSVKENGFLYGDDSKEVFRDLGDTGIRTGDEWAYNSLYCDPVSGYTFWSVYDGGDAVKLYALAPYELVDDALLAAYFLGSLPQGDWPFVGVYGTSGRDGYSFEVKRKEGR